MSTTKLFPFPNTDTLSFYKCLVPALGGVREHNDDKKSGSHVTQRCKVRLRGEMEPNSNVLILDQD